MERAGNLRKRSNVWRPWCGSTASPLKFGGEKSKLSLRSENTITTGTVNPAIGTRSPQPLSSNQKQTGKENESPSSLRDQAGKIRSTVISKTTSKRRKLLNPIKLIVNSERDPTRRRLSGDCENQSSANKLYPGGRDVVEPMHNLPRKIVRTIQGDASHRNTIIPKFSIYNDEENNYAGPSKPQQAAEPAKEEEASETCSSESYGSRHLRKYASSMSEITRNEGSIKSDELFSAKQKWSNDPELLDSRSIFDGQLSGTEFRIERIDCNGKKLPTTNNYRRVSSGPILGRLNIPLRRGDDISPLKRRMIELKKKTALNWARSGTNQERAANSKTGLEGVRGLKNIGRPKLSSLDRKRDQKCFTQTSATESSNGAEEKSGNSVKPDQEKRAKTITTVKKLTMPEVEAEISRSSFLKCKQSTHRSVQEPMSKFCQPALHHKSFNLKDDFIEFTYNDSVHNDQAEPHWAKSMFQDSLPRLHPIPNEVELPRANAQRRSLDDASVVEEICHATDYADETIDFERAREKSCHKISKTFLKGKSITPVQRKIVVNFLISVHAYLSTHSSTLYQAIQIFDSVLDIKNVLVEELQLVALAAFWIAIKNMETAIPTASEMISFAKDMYHAEGPKLLCKCERNILKTLGFNIRFPDPSYISAYYLHRWSSYLGTTTIEPVVRKTVYHCAGYLMDVALLDVNYSGISIERLAVVTTDNAARLVLDASWKHQTSRSPLMIRTMPRNFAEDGMDESSFVDPLLAGVIDSAEKGSSTASVYKKYKSSKYNSVSDYLVMKIKKFTRSE